MSDHEIRQARSKNIKVEGRPRQIMSAKELHVKMRDKSTKRKIVHTVVMKKKRNTGSLRVNAMRTRADPGLEDKFETNRYVPVNIHLPIRYDFKIKMKDPKDAMEQVRRGPQQTFSTYKSVKCTCPDWAYRGTWHQGDRQYTNTEDRLRAVEGCKHMIKADEEYANF